MGLFDFRREEEARNRKMMALVAGCHRHPSYRYKRKPTGKCQTCLELFDFHEQLKEWDARVNDWWKVYHRVEKKRMDEEYRAMEDRLNCPG